jgi:Fic family protein
MAGGESVRAFVTAALPPVAPLAFDGGLQRGLETALLALGRLDGFSAQLPDTSLFLYTYVRKEAVLSSQIEGAQFKEDRRRIETTGRRAGSALRVHEALKAHPLLSLPAICQRTDLNTFDMEMVRSFFRLKAEEIEDNKEEARNYGREITRMLTK